MKKTHLLTVIVTVHNEENFIDSCLSSLILDERRRQLVEVIVVNDGSTDNSEDIISSYQMLYDNFKIINLPYCQGVSVARNTGIINSTGKYILFVDGDDFLISENFGQLVDFIDLHYEKDIILYGVVFFNETQQPIKHTERPEKICGTGYELFDSWIRSGFYSAIRNKVVLRDYIIRNSIFFLPGIIYEDVLWTARLFAYDATVAYVDIYVYGNRMHNNSTTKTASLRSRIFALSKIYESLENIACEKNSMHPSYSRALKAILSGIFFQLLSNVRQFLPSLQPEEQRYYIDYLEQRKDIIRFSYKFRRKYIYYPIANLFGIETLIKLRK